MVRLSGIFQEQSYYSVSFIVKDLKGERMRIKLDEGAFEPIHAHREDAGVDLRTPEEFIIQPHDSHVINTGVHVDLPVGTYGKIESKSGLNVKHGIVSLGGVIDSGYTGSIVVKLYNMSDEEYHFRAGDKVAQMIIQPCVVVNSIIVVDEIIKETDRGDSGFGSSGR